MDQYKNAQVKLYKNIQLKYILIYQVLKTLSDLIWCLSYGAILLSTGQIIW